MAFKKPENDIIALVIVLLIGAMYYYVSLNSSLIFGDETFYALEAKAIHDTSFMPKFDAFVSTDIWHVQFIRPPIYIFIITFAFSLLGDLGIKLIVPLFTILSGILTYLFMKKVGWPEGGLAATLILMMLPGIVTYGVMNYVETLLMLLSIMTLYFGYICFETKSKKYAVLTGIAAMFMLLTDTTGVFIMAVLFFYSILMVIKNKSYKEYGKLFGIIAVVALILVSPFFIREAIIWGSACYLPFIDIGACYGIADNPVIQQPTGLSFDASVAPEGTGLPILKFGLLNYITFALSIPLLLTVCLGISGVFSAKSNFTNMLLLWLGMFLIVTFAVSTSSRSEDAVRFTMFGFPSLAIISGMFMSSIYKKFDKNKLTTLVIIFLIIASSFYFGYYKFGAMLSIKQNSFQGLVAACVWVDKNTANDSLFYSIYSRQTAWLCDRHAKSTVPDKEAIALTNNDTSYQHLKLHGYDYVLIEAFTISNQKYEEGNTIDFVNYLQGSSKFERVFDNTNTYGQNGILIYKVL